MHTYIWKVKPLNSKILIMVFSWRFIFSFPIGDFIFLFLLRRIMQVMIGADKSYNNKQKQVFVVFQKDMTQGTCALGIYITPMKFNPSSKCILKC